MAYAEYSGSVVIADGRLLEGDLPNKALSMVREWMSLHREELQRMWDTQEFVEIPGLD